MNFRSILLSCTSPRRIPLSSGASRGRSTSSSRCMGNLFVSTLAETLAHGSGDSGDAHAWPVLRFLRARLHDASSSVRRFSVPFHVARHLFQRRILTLRRLASEAALGDDDDDDDADAIVWLNILSLFLLRLSSRAVFLFLRSSFRNDASSFVGYILRCRVERPTTPGVLHRFG